MRHYIALPEMEALAEGSRKTVARKLAKKPGGVIELAQPSASKSSDLTASLFLPRWRTVHLRSHNAANNLRRRYPFIFLNGTSDRKIARQSSTSSTLSHTVPSRTLRSCRKRNPVFRAQLIDELTSERDDAISKQSEADLGLPWTASIIAAAATAAASAEVEVARRRGSMSSTMFSAPGEDFLSLCRAQLQLASKVLGQDTSFTVYIRTPESYASGQVDLQPVALFPELVEPDFLDIVRLVGGSQEPLPERQAEHWLVREEAIEVSEKRAMVLPMSRGSFLVGLLIAERPVSFAEASGSAEDADENGQRDVNGATGESGADDVNGAGGVNGPEESVGSNSSIVDQWQQMPQSPIIDFGKKKESGGYASAGRGKGRMPGKRGKAGKVKKQASSPASVIESPRQIRQRLRSMGKGFSSAGEVKEIIDIPSQEVSVSEDEPVSEDDQTVSEETPTVSEDHPTVSSDDSSVAEDESANRKEERSSRGSEASSSGRIFDWSKLDVDQLRAQRAAVREGVKLTRAQAIGKQLQELFSKKDEDESQSDESEGEEAWSQEHSSPSLETSDHSDSIDGSVESSTGSGESFRGSESTESEESFGGSEPVVETGGVYSVMEREVAVEVAKTIAMAAVMDQRTLFLQQANWQRGVRLDGMLEQVRGPLAALRTLGKSLMPVTKEGEVSRDVAENIVVQGERMKDVIVQIQDELYPSQGAGNLVHYDRQALPATAGPKTAALLEASRSGGRGGGFVGGGRTSPRFGTGNGAGVRRGDGLEAEGG
ncbi:hypothetical protein KFL_001730070, partial [Klebsormidium nitens]